MTSEEGGSGDNEEWRAGEAVPLAGMSEGATQSTGAEVPMEAVPQVEGRRTQLKIVRENIYSLSREIANFRKRHDVSIKKLEKHLAVLRSELAPTALSKEVGSFRKSHAVSTKRIEKQVTTLRNELASLKMNIAKDAARSRAKQEATLSRILAKVSAKSSKPSKPSKGKRKKKR